MNSCIFITVLLVFFLLIKFVVVAFCFNSSKDKFETEEEKKKKKGEKDNTMTVREYLSSLNGDVPTAYLFLMTCLCAVECLLTKMVFDEWFMFVTWWSVGVCILSAVVPNLYVRYCLKRYRSEKGEVYKRIREKGVEIASRVFSGSDEMLREYERESDKKMRSEAADCTMSLDGKVPYWVENHVGGFVLACQMALTIAFIAMVWMNSGSAA